MIKNKLFIYSLAICSIFFVFLFMCSCSYTEITTNISNSLTNYLSSVHNDSDYINKNMEDSCMVVSESKLDYPNLTDEQFANFRQINTAGFKESLIYRSCSPIVNTERSKIADKLIESYGIDNIINLDNTYEEAISFSGYESTYYSKKNILFAPISESLDSQSDTDNLVAICNFINSNNGKFLIHCNDGYIKTGLVCAILETLRTSSYNLIHNDFSASYHLLNINKNIPDNIDFILDKQFRLLLSAPLGAEYENIIYLNLNRLTKGYLQRCGLSNQDIEQLINKLSK